MTAAHERTVLAELPDREFEAEITELTHRQGVFRTICQIALRCFVLRSKVLNGIEKREDINLSDVYVGAERK